MTVSFVQYDYGYEPNLLPNALCYAVNMYMLSAWVWPTFFRYTSCLSLFSQGPKGWSRFTVWIPDLLPPSCVEDQATKKVKFIY